VNLYCVLYFRLQEGKVVQSVNLELEEKNLHIKKLSQEISKLKEENHDLREIVRLTKKREKS